MGEHVCPYKRASDSEARVGGVVACAQTGWQTVLSVFDIIFAVVLRKIMCMCAHGRYITGIVSEVDFRVLPVLTYS
jgi:hypothetical protein